MMTARSEYYWQAANTINYPNGDDYRRPLACEPDKTRDGRVTLILRDLNHPSHDIRRHLTSQQALRFAKLISTRANGIETTDPGQQLAVSITRSEITLRFIGGRDEGHIALTWTQADDLARWLTNMANRQYVEVA